MKNPKSEYRNPKQIQNSSIQNSKQFWSLKFLSFDIVSYFGFRASDLSQNAFTLIELLVSVSITIVAGALLIVILGQNNSIFLKQQSNVLQGVSLNEAGIVISDSIKQASSVAATSPTTPVYTTSINTLVLEVPSIDNSGNVIPSVFDYFVIAPDNSQPNILRLMVFPTNPSVRRSQNQVLLTSLSTIRFLYFNPDSNQVNPVNATKVNYTINLKEKAGLAYQQSSASGEVNLRNN